MGKRLIFIVLVIALCTALLVVASRHSRQSLTMGSHRIRVVTTLFPLYDFVKNVGREKVDVSLLLPPGIEAHSFEPKPGDVVRINEADIFVYTGKFMEPWAEDILKGVSNKDLVVVDASRGTRLIPGVSPDGAGHEASLDPHCWLDIDNAKIMVENILGALEIKDGTNKDFFRHNGDDYLKRLSEMDSAYRAALAHCRDREIVYGGHYAFGYMAHRYGLRYLAAQGLSPDAEPTAGDLARLVDQIRKDDIKYVFYEELTSPKIAEVIARETGARMLLLNAAHNVTKEQYERGISFLDILKGDLDNLKLGLGCQ